MYVDDLIELLKNKIRATEIEIIDDYFKFSTVSLSRKLENFKFVLKFVTLLKSKYQDILSNP